MAKNILIVALILLSGFLGYKFYMYRSAYKMLLAQNAPQSNNPRRTPPPILKKGDEFAKSSIFKYAVQIFPGDLTADAKKALNGFDFKATDMNDGSTQVTLTSKDSDDQSQVYTVKKGETLYFIEMTTGDDKTAGHDANLRDDYGVVVDASGMVQ